MAGISLRLLLGILCLGCILAGCATQNQYRPEARKKLLALADGRPVNFVKSVKELPASIRKDLAGIADAGEAFSADCEGRHPHERFLIATENGTTYDVALERGGYAHTWVIMEFVLDESGRIVNTLEIQPNNVEF